MYIYIYIIIYIYDYVYSMYPNITKVPRYLILEAMEQISIETKKSRSVAAQVLHPIFRRPGLPTCEAILAAQIWTIGKP